MELCKSAEAHKQLEFFEEYGHTTATTLRLTKPYWGKGYVVVGDAWFGSVKCAYELLKRETFSVMNVKNAHKFFPKAEIRAKMKERGD